MNTSTTKSLKMRRTTRGSLGLALSLMALLTCTSQVQADTQVRTSSFEYDASGLLTKEVIEPDRANDCLQTTYSYDNYGNKTGASKSACAGANVPAINSATTARTWSTSFGSEGRFPVSSSNALSQSETKTFDARFGAITSLTGPNGLTTTWVYDGFGRKTRETRADGTFTTWVYQLCTESGANCPATVGPATIVWVVTEQSFAANLATNTPEKRQYYDSLNRVVRTQTQGYDGTVAAPTLVQDTEFNNLGYIKRRSNQYALTGGTPVWSDYVYDVMGRPLSESHPDPAAPGGMATISYSYDGLTTSVTNAKGQTKTTTKNAQGQVAVVTDSQGNTIDYSYDAQGNLLATNAAGSITSMSYDIRGNKTAMLDPVMGSWIYSYNVFGELVAQRDSLSQSSTIAYDVLGRLIQRSEPDLVSQWSYDKKFDGTSCGKGIGKLCEAKADNGYNRTHSYDSLGRVNTTTTVLDNAATPVSVSEAFDANTGRVTSKTWPTGFQAFYTYTPLGYLKTVTGGGTNGFTQTVSHTVMAMNAQGQITQYKTGNLVTTVASFDAATQRLTAQTATLDGQSSGNVLNHSYSYDALGNLMTRGDNTPGVGTQESFSYDSLNRLTTATILGGGVSPPSTTEVQYDARGNIAYKSDVGRYWYDAVRPNRMTNVTLETASGATVSVTGTRSMSYVFDDLRAGAQTVNGTTVGNGNLEYTVMQDTVNAIHTVRGESYTSFNMPRQITYGNFITNTTSTSDRTLSFIYGPEHQRIKQNIALTGNGTSSYFAGNVWYLNGEDSLGLTYEKEVRANGTTENKHYVSAGGVVFAEFISRTGTLNGLPATSIHYFHHDHLGSIAAITNESGVVTERLAYDPWGKRRYINTTPGQPDILDAIVGKNTDRGYTMHEHLDEIGIIHMNGRIYDPLIGRFMSADPIIQAPNNLQSFNRYAYVMNNPLSLTDPSGFSWWTSLRDSVIKPVAVIAVAYFTAGYVQPYMILNGYSVGMATIVAGAAGGAMAGVISSGTLQGAAQGAFTGALFGAAGGVGEASSAGRYLAHAAAGCISSVAGSGNCGSGAASALFGKYATNNINFGDVVANGVATVVAGGVGSVIAGGKFENGATTAAYGYLFNYCAHNGCFNRRFDWNDAVDQWRNGNGSTVTDVKASELNLTDATYTKNPSGTYQINTSIEFDTGAIYGTVTGVLNTDGTMRILPDVYDFDFKNPMTASDGWRVFRRDVLTGIGLGINGVGTPFRIEFTGSIPVPNNLPK